jgi:TerC family integral membrane protein
MTSTIWPWIVFTVFVLGMLALDLGVFHRDAHLVTKKEAALWSLVWILLALVFNASIYYVSGPVRALEFLTGYLIEKSLSVDNIFVFIMIFSYFAVPAIYQHKVLFWGILGALLMRGLFIAVGAALLQHFHWIIYIFGALLVFTGIKMLLKEETAPLLQSGKTLPSRPGGVDVGGTRKTTVTCCWSISTRRTKARMIWRRVRQSAVANPPRTLATKSSS